MPRIKTAPIVTPAVDSLNLPDNGRYQEVADWLQITVSHLRSEVWSGKIKPLRLGKRDIFPKEEVLRYRSEVAQEQGVMSAVR